MQCDRCQSLLFDFVDGTLDATTRRDLETHLESCALCQEFAEALGTPAPEQELGAIFAIAGDRCGSCEERLPDWVDATLGAIDRQIVDEHLEHCEGCRQFAATLQTMSAELPALRDAPDDERLVQQILRSTLPQPSLGERFDRWIAALMKRPRIAWEGAYVLTALLTIAILLPGSPLGNLPQQLLTLTEEERLSQPFVAFGDSVQEGSLQANAWVRRARVESGVAVEGASRQMGTLWNRLASPSVTPTTEEGRLDGED